MIRGTVTLDRGPLVPLILRGPHGDQMDVNAVIDTGFTASLTIPPQLVATLGLVLGAEGKLKLADGTIRRFEQFTATVFWNGAWRSVLASALGDDILVGLRMLEGHSLTVEVQPGGLVEIAPLQ